MLYHVTPSSNVENILRVGLEPRIGQASEMIPEDKPRVYLFNNLEYVEEAVITWLGEVYWNVDLSVLAVDATADSLGGEEGGFEVTTERVVPPSLIHEMTTDELGFEL